MDNGKVKIAYYTRVSTKGQKESGLGLEAQLSMLENFTKNISKRTVLDEFGKGKEISNIELVRHFEENVSGKAVSNRPILQDAIEFCLKNECILCVAKLDRLSRSVTDGLQIFRKLEKKYLFSCDVPTENGLIKDEFMLTLLFAFAERERELIAHRTKSALDAKKERVKDGLETWSKKGIPTENYRENWKKIDYAKVAKAAVGKTDPNKNLSKAKTDATILRKNGKTLTEIAKTLTDKGHLTSRSKAGIFETSHKWTPTAVKRLLENDKI